MVNWGPCGSGGTPISAQGKEEIKKVLEEFFGDENVSSEVKEFFDNNMPKEVNDIFGKINEEGKRSRRVFKV